MKGASKSSIWPIAVVLLLFGFLFLTEPGKDLMNNAGSFLGSSVGDGDDVGSTDNFDCQSTTTPDLDPNTYDSENPATAFTEATNLYREVGDTSWTTFTQGTAITGLTVGEKYELLFGITTSDQTDNAYGPHMVTDEIPCLENVPFDDVMMYDDSIETALTATFYNSNHDASAQTFTAADQTKTVYLKWEADTDNYFGNPYVPSETPNILCLDLNVTEHDAPNYVKVGGQEMHKVSIPVRHSASTGDTAYCYEAPIVDEGAIEFTVSFNADDTLYPVGDGLASLYAAGWFVDNDTGSVEWGVEDEDGAAVATDAADTLTLDFT